MLVASAIRPPWPLAPTSSAGLAMVGLSLAVLMPSLDTSIANAGLPVLAVAFGASFQQMQWVVLSYLLAITSLSVTAGRLGDLLGRRTLLLTAIVVFTVASILCGLSSSIVMLLAARTAQGLGAAAMMALTMALAGDAAATARTGRAMGLLGAMSAIGTALGPSLGGVLMATFGWRSIFLVNVPMGVAAFVLVQRNVTSDHARASRVRERFDLGGTLMLAIALSAYALSMTRESGSIRWALTSLIAFALFYLVETRTESPVVRFSMMRDHVLVRGLVMTGLVSTVMMTTLVVGPFYLSRVFGVNTMAAGLLLSMGPLVAALTGPPAGRAVDRMGARRMTIVGLSGIAIGAITVVAAPATLGVGAYVGPVAIMTAGYASFQAANNASIMSGAPVERRGVVAGVLSLSRYLGLITGAAAMGAVFARATGEHDLMSATAAAITTGMRTTYAVAATLIMAALGIALMRRSDRHY